MFVYVLIFGFISDICLMLFVYLLVLFEFSVIIEFDGEDKWCEFYFVFDVKIFFYDEFVDIIY